MTKRVNAIIDGFNMPKNGFSFVAKSGKSDYRVFDTIGGYYFERKLPYRTGSEALIELLVEALKKLGAGYKIISPNEVQIFDPSVEKYEDVEFPLYKELSIYRYSYIGCDYIVKNVPTRKMIKAAEKYMEYIEKVFHRIELLSEISVCIGINDSVSTIIKKDNDIFEVLTGEDLQRYYIRTLSKPYRGYGKYVNLVIDRNAIKNRELHVNVPNEWAGIVIGKGGRCTQEIKKDLDLKYFEVHAY